MEIPWPCLPRILVYSLIVAKTIGSVDVSENQT
jgi:hypothetical protein